MKRTGTFGRARAVLVAMILVAAMTIVAVPLALAGTAISVGPSIPTGGGSVTVGATGVASSLSITNNSTAPENVGTIGVTNATLTVVSGVFSLSATGTGDASTPGCAGSTWNITGGPATFTFTPTSPVNLTSTHASPLLPTFDCQINFTVDVLTRPATEPTDYSSTVAGLWSVNGTTPATGSGASSTTIDKVSPTLPTTPSAGGPIGTVLNDSATVTGGLSPTGTVDFALFAPADTACAGPAVYTQNAVPLVGTTATTSPGFPSTEAGTYRWTAHYSGDGNNNSADSGCTAEPVIVDKVSPTLPTTPSAGGPIGTVLNDSATVTGGSSPTGTVDFALFAPADTACAGPAVYTQNAVPLVGTTATTSPGFPSTEAGTYRWTAHYSGDGNNNSADSGCTAEPVIVDKVSPTLPTTPSAGGPIGTVLNDSATVTGGSSPTGTVDFALFAPADTACAGPAVYTQNAVPLVGTTATTSPGFPSTEAGTYRWTAHYSGDGNNNSADSGCTAEPVIVDKVSPTLPTTPSAGGPIGTVLNDSATVTGGSSPTGTVDFALFAPADTACAGPAVYTQNAVPLVGTTATTSPGFPSTEAGTYRWTAHYSGDGNNNSADSGCTAEPVIVVDANIQITPATATNPVGTNHVLTITVNAIGGTLGAGTATATIVSGPGSFVGSPTCTYAGGAANSCTVTITSLAAGTTVVSATSNISVGAFSITRTTNTAENTASGGSGNAQKTWTSLTSGRVTGGGSIFATVNGVPNVRVTHGFELRCDPTDPRQSLEINWDGGNNFHLDKLINSVVCFDDPTTQPPPPPGTVIDTYAGNTLFNGSTGYHGFGYAVGTGTCNKEPATIYFILIDAGEPGTADIAEYHIVSAGCTLDAGPAQLLKGNHQFHKN